MKRTKKIKGLETSSRRLFDNSDDDCTGNFHTSSLSSPARTNGTTRKTKQMKRKNSDEDTSILLPATSNVMFEGKVQKKKQKITMNEFPVHDLDSSEVDYNEPSDSENNYENYPSFLANIASDIYDTSDSEIEELVEAEGFENLSSENFDEKMEFARHSYEDIDSDESDDFFVEKKKQLLVELKSEPAKKKAKSVIITAFPSRNLMVVLLNHPASLTLYKYVSVEVLSGCISICGYEVNAQHTPIKVFSSERTGFIGLKTESFEQVWMKKSFYNLCRKLEKITENKLIAHKILNKFGNSTVVVVVEGCTFPPNLQFLELYCPHELQFKLRKKNKLYYHIPQTLGKGLEFGPDAENLADEIISAVRKSKLNNKSGPVILIYGPRNSGKSSLLQFLINKTLSMFPSVFYLDADPGQTEFTPPGVVSLSKVEQPVIGPSFTHQRKPISMIFTGASSAESSPFMYLKSIRRLVSKFESEYYYEPLFVNTMGWITGLGLTCLEGVISSTQPTILGEVVFEESSSSLLDYKKLLLGKTKYFQIFSPTFDRIPGMKAYEYRNLALLSYFGKCQLPHLRPNYIEELSPVCVSWDKIAIFVFGKKVPPQRIPEALNASFVALCKVPLNEVLVSRIPQYPRLTLTEEPYNECLGFGIVRAVDEVNHLMYIVTPMNLKELANVNAIMKGNIWLPDSVLLKQQIVGIPLPFTNDTSNYDDTKSFRRKVGQRYKQNHKIKSK